MAFSTGTVDIRAAIAADDETSGKQALYETLNFLIDCTDDTGTTLDVEVQWSHNNSTWFSFPTPDAFAQITATGGTFLSVASRAGWFRLAYVVVGGAFDFEVSLVGYA